MKTIDQTYQVQAPISKVWDALVNTETIEKWGGGTAVMDDKVGTEFSLWDGDIRGKNTKVIPGKLLEQEWFSGTKWERPSIVTFSLVGKDNVTELHLHQVEVPDNDADSIDQGWHEYYLGPLQELLENGV